MKSGNSPGVVYQGEFDQVGIHQRAIYQGGFGQVVIHRWGQLTGGNLIRGNSPGGIDQGGILLVPGEFSYYHVTHFLLLKAHPH